MPPEDRTEQLNAAFDAMGDGLTDAELEEMTAAMTDLKTVEDVVQRREQIAALASVNKVTQLRVFEQGSDDEALRQHGNLGFLVFSSETCKMRHLIRLFEGLRELLGTMPDLIDSKFCDEDQLADLVERSLKLYRA